MGKNKLNALLRRVHRANFDENATAEDFRKALIALGGCAYDDWIKGTLGAHSMKAMEDSARLDVPQIGEEENDVE